ncbi:MAG: InlB B-repeat-containing protein [Treponema sp.]|nr:InlB B-repeat-containing protein [Treponema sp.]
MKINHGRYQAKARSALAGVAVLLLAAMFTFAGCKSKAEVVPEPEPEPELANYTVTFNTNGGNAIEAKTVQEGAALGSLATPSYDGHAFVAWFDSNSEFAAANVVTSATTITKDTTVYAQWVDAVAYGAQEDGSWILDPASSSATWYGAEVVGDVAIYTGGVIDYLFPTDEGFDIQNYESMTVNYFVYGWEPMSNIDDDDKTKTQLAIKDWNGEENGNDSRNNTRNYPVLTKGAADSFTIGSTENDAGELVEYFAKLQAEGIKGVSFAANAYADGSIEGVTENRGGGIHNYKVKFYSIKLNPKQ